MAAEKVIPVEPDSEIDRLLDEMDKVDDVEVILARPDARFRLRRDVQDRADGATILYAADTTSLDLVGTPPTGGMWEGYDARRVQEALRLSAGALRGIDREAFLTDLWDAREQDARGTLD